MFAEFTKLQRFGYDSSDANQNHNTFVGSGARRYIVDSSFPENILKNNPDIIDFNTIFRDCEAKDFPVIPKFPGTMFAKATKLQNINSILRDAHFAFTLSSNGFANCPDLNNVGFAFYCEPSSNKIIEVNLLEKYLLNYFIMGIL